MSATGLGDIAGGNPLTFLAKIARDALRISIGLVNPFLGSEAKELSKGMTLQDKWRNLIYLNKMLISIFNKINPIKLAIDLISNKITPQTEQLKAIAGENELLRSSDNVNQYHVIPRFGGFFPLSQIIPVLKANLLGEMILEDDVTDEKVISLYTGIPESHIDLVGSDAGNYGNNHAMILTYNQLSLETLVMLEHRMLKSRW
jgi:hypothetical protein